MGFLLAFFGVALAACAWRTDDRTLRWWLLGCAALNLGALLAMWVEGDAYLFRLRPPDDDVPEPPWRR
jgi:hypothetical protein